jgi:hypothetical protein
MATTQNLAEGVEQVVRNHRALTMWVRLVAVLSLALVRVVLAVQVVL